MFASGQGVVKEAAIIQASTRAMAIRNGRSFDRLIIGSLSAHIGSLTEKILQLSF
jgi:hypothetical protein